MPRLLTIRNGLLHHLYFHMLVPTLNKIDINLDDCQVGYLQSEEAATWVVGGSLVGSSIGVRA
jgi:hypothetical protein